MWVGGFSRRKASAGGSQPAAPRQAWVGPAQGYLNPSQPTCSFAQRSLVMVSIWSTLRTCRCSGHAQPGRAPT